MIETERLSRSYGDTLAVSELTLKVERGEILGFLGPNGAGKSTTVKMLTGLLRPTSGTARVAGFDIAKHPLEVKRRIGYVPESGAMYESLSASEYLELIACLHHLEPRVARARADEFFELFGLGKVRHQRLAEYSKGMKQKILFAAALIHRPEVLFLDEPLNGLDANAALIVKDLLRKLAAQGRAVFFCSHILEVVERVCTRIVIIDHGSQIVAGSASEIIRATATTTLEEAFSSLTGVRDVGALTEDLLAALEQE